MASSIGTVAVVIQNRITDESKGAYASWQVRVGERLASQPGFLGQEVRTPRPPEQVDWFVIQHFRDHASAQAWMESDELSTLLREIEGSFVGDSNISIVDDAASGYQNATVAVSCKVLPEREAEFMDWERKIFRAEARFPGFVGHRLERPIPGLQPRWKLVLTFSTDADLTRWLESPERSRLIEEGAKFQSDVQVDKVGYGFDFWSGPAERKDSPATILKGNLIVLTVLYPVVFLWGYFVGSPLLGSWPFWLALFIGNLFSTQLLGWYVAPKAFQALGWWLGPDVPLKKQVQGYAIVLGVNAISLAVYAWLLNAKLMG
jgi:antibiotic biosynthesis monooxygenase (ABM) superfamily enzyme